MTNASDRAQPPRNTFRRLKVIHCYTAPWEDCPAGTPPVLMIAALDLSSANHFTAAVHLAAEPQRMSPTEMTEHLLDLERDVLSQFNGYLERHRRCRWLHWNMDSALYGFPAIAQRARVVGAAPVEIPERNLINLAAALKQTLGEGYVPHPRLEALIRLNEISDHGWLNIEQLTAAARAGNYTPMLRSLLRRVQCIATVFELFVTNRLRHHGLATAACPLRSLLGSAAPRKSVGGSASVGLSAQRPPGWVAPPNSPAYAQVECLSAQPTREAEPSEDARDLAEAVEPNLIVEQSSRSTDEIEWTTPDLPSQWARLFRVSRSTFMRRLQEGSIRHKKLSSKSYQIAVADLPAMHREKFRNPAGQRSAEGAGPEH